MKKLLVIILLGLNFVGSLFSSQPSAMALLPYYSAVKALDFSCASIIPSSSLPIQSSTFSDYSIPSNDESSSTLSKIGSATASAVSTVGSVTFSAAEFAIRNPQEALVIVGITVSSLGYVSFKIRDWWSRRKARLQQEHIENNKKRYKQDIEKTQKVMLEVEEMFKVHTEFFGNHTSFLINFKEEFDQSYKTIVYNLDGMAKGYKELSCDISNYSKIIVNMNENIEDCVQQSQDMRELLVSELNLKNATINSQEEIKVTSDDIQVSIGNEQDLIEKITNIFSNMGRNNQVIENKSPMPEHN